MLKSIVRRTDDSGHEVGHEEIEQDTDLSPEDVQRAIKALHSDGGYIVVSTPSARGHIDFVLSATSKARREVGAWPTSESVLQALIERLVDIAADDSQDEDTRARARKIKDALSGGGSAVLTSVLSSVIAGQLGG